MNDKTAGTLRQASVAASVSSITSHSYRSANWSTLVTAACDAFEASIGQQDSAVGSRIAKNAEINDNLIQMIALKTTISHMVPNFCSGNPGAIASWTSAAHVESPPKKKLPPTPRKKRMVLITKMRRHIVAALFNRRIRQ